jgi:hypothetical protein
MLAKNVIHFMLLMLACLLIRGLASVEADALLNA